VDQTLSKEQQNIKELEATFLSDEEADYYASKDRVLFESETTSMDLRYLVDCGEVECPLVKVQIDETSQGLKGNGVFAEFELNETQEVTFVLREVLSSATLHNREKETAHDRKIRLAYDPPLTLGLLQALFRQTSSYWLNWVSQSTYKGRWRENVLRSALTLKLLTYEPVRGFHVVL
jgi:GH15 family glucan-1,4-alpha-glucosidase